MITRKSPKQNLISLCNKKSLSSLKTKYTLPSIPSKPTSLMKCSLSRWEVDQPIPNETLFEDILSPSFKNENFN